MTIDFGYKRNRQIFTDIQEAKLTEYIRHAASIYFGLSPGDVRKLAYECALLYELQIPGSWNENKRAGRDWFSSFMKRNTDISVRSPEPTSIARATSFNRNTVQAFFAKLAEVIDRYGFQPGEFWNMDESGVTTVQKPSKVVAQKGLKQIGAVTSQERGTLVTVVVPINALENSALPMLQRSFH